jgi:hypothetical protein
MTSPAQPPKRENPLINIVCNIVVPTVVLMKFSTDQWLGPLWGLIVALIFPVSYGVYDLIERKKTNYLSILGLVSVLLSGGFTLLKLGGIWFAVKDAALPTMIGLGILLSLRSKAPLVRELLYNESIIDVPRVDAALAARGKTGEFETLLKRASVGLALTMLASAPVNFALALYILKSPPGTPEFNADLGKMHWVSFVVIVLPSMVAMMFIFWKLMGGLVNLSGLTQDEIFPDPKAKQTPKA